MSVYFKVKVAQTKLFIEKAKKEAYKLAVAVVIAEFVLVTGFAIGESRGLFDRFKSSNPLVIENVHAQTRVIAEAVEPVDPIKEIADYIWNRESTRGKNNYSKCEAIGKVNGVGYGIPGNGDYVCFESHEDEMRTLEGWIIAKLAQGHTETSLLCLYSGSNYKDVCTK